MSSTPTNAYALHDNHNDSSFQVEKTTGTFGKEVESGEPTPHGVPEKRTKRFFCWHLPKKQWIYALVGLILGVLLVAFLIVWFAVIPAIFQSKIDHVELTLNHFDLLKMSSDPKSKELGVDVSIHVKTDGSVNAVMDATDISLYYEGEEFGILNLAEQDIRKDRPEYDIVIRQTTEVTGLEAFYKLSSDYVTDKTVKIEAKGKVDVHAFGLTGSGLKLERELEIKALDNFNDPISKINDMALVKCDADFITLDVNITLDNDSQVGLDGIGVLNVTVNYFDQFIGQAILTKESAAAGIPRGKTPMIYELAVATSGAPLAVFGTMMKDLLARKQQQFYINGINDYVAMDARILTTALHSLNMSVPYKGSGDITQDVHLEEDSGCNLADLLKAALG